MTNYQKFREVFGLDADKYLCPISLKIGCELCPYSDNCNDDSDCVKFWKAEYKDKYAK